MSDRSVSYNSTKIEWHFNKFVSLVEDSDEIKLENNVYFQFRKTNSRKNLLNRLFYY